MCYSVFYVLFCCVYLYLVKLNYYYSCITVINVIAKLNLFIAITFIVWYYNNVIMFGRRVLLLNLRSEERQKVLQCIELINATRAKIKNEKIEQDSSEWNSEVEDCLKQIINVCDCHYEYSFTRSITEFIGKFGMNAKKTLEDLLISKTADLSLAEKEENQSDRDVAFAAYYGLSILFKDDYELRFLNSLIEQYSVFFDDYLLSYEVLSRLEKRKVRVGEKETNTIKLNKALDYDSVAIEKIAEKYSARNSGVEISYVSTVCRMLEMKIDVPQEKIEKARRYAEYAINQYGDYAKYYYSLGKLFVALAELSYDEKLIEEYIGKAKSNFGQAINHENHDFYHHNSRISKYNAEQNNAEIVLLKKRLELEMKSVEKNVGNFNSRCADIEIQVDEKIKKNKKQTIELLAIFTAVLQIIIGVINFTSTQTNVLYLIVTIIVLNVSTLGVYAAYLKIAADKNSETGKRAGSALVLVSLILAFCIFAAYKLI